MYRTLNKDTEDWGALAAARSRAVAFCSSQACCGKKLRVLKTLTGKPDNCPDCGSALFWTKRAVGSEEVGYLRINKENKNERVGESHTKKL